MTEFSWTKNWYPIFPLSYLDPSVPTSITILDKKLVIWRDKNDKWIVMDDQCPHKLAQLSKGTIKEDGTLMCRHHGWCFNGEGQCTTIPMLVGNEALETACNSVRSQVKIYPTQINQGLLWVWPDDSITAFEDSNNKQPATIPECGLDSNSTDWHMSEVPVGYTVSFESSFDPSHAQFLHEGIAGFSPEKTVPISRFETVGKISGEIGFTLKHTGYNIVNQDMEGTRQFTPPCCNTTIYEYPNGVKILFQLYFIPTKPGYCRYIGKVISSQSFTTNNILLNSLPKNLRTGFSHLLNYKLSDQDLSIMHSQEVVQSNLEQSWNKAYFLPSPADLGIITFRKWLDEFADGGPFSENNDDNKYRELTDEQLYDRWYRHTQYCPSCQSAVTFLDKLQTYSQITTIILVVITLIFLLIPISIKWGIVSTIIAIITLLLSNKIDDIRHLFMSSLPKKGLPRVNLYEHRK
jgi:phenylpropionate dioxygenase-like ring-hydroxylating dioxygenase large terminal subunit